MTPHRREGLFFVGLLLLLASAVHLGTVYLIPRIIMHRALDRMGTPNTVHFGRRPDATSRAVVRPSPDLLYATCPFDLSTGPLRIEAQVPHDTYWSVSAFDSATNNFFVRNDQQTAGTSLEIILLRHGQALPPFGTATEQVVLFAPNETGLILFRTLIDDEKRLPAIIAESRKVSCRTVAPAAKVH